MLQSCMIQCLLNIRAHPWSGSFLIYMNCFTFVGFNVKSFSLVCPSGLQINRRKYKDVVTWSMMMDKPGDSPEGQVQFMWHQNGRANTRQSEKPNTLSLWMYILWFIVLEGVTKKWLLQRRAHFFNY